MNLVKAIILAVSLFLSSSAFAGITFNPNLVAGAGAQLADETAFYINLKSYLLTSNKLRDTDILGIGFGINTLGNIQFVFSPVGFTFFESFNIAPDIGVGVNRGEQVTAGISLGFVF